jgi:DNA-binding MarR family transcriptional regulator
MGADHTRRSDGDDDEPRWLSEPETDAWLDVWAIVAQLPAVLEAQLQRDAHLGLYEYMVMARLSMAPERECRMGELAKLTDGSMSRLSNVVKRLEADGFVRRQPDPANGRFVIATLTDAGYAAVESAAPGHVRAVRHYLFDPLTSPQVDDLRRISARISDRIRADAEHSLPSRRHQELSAASVVIMTP